jgi:hypothetical protein
MYKRIFEEDLTRLSNSCKSFKIDILQLDNNKYKIQIRRFKIQHYRKKIFRMYYTFFMNNTKTILNMLVLDCY